MAAQFNTLDRGVIDSLPPPLPGAGLTALVSTACSSKKNPQKRHMAISTASFLIAMPTMTDKRFARSVIYMCAHSAQGAMGLIVNQRAPHISFSELLGQLSIGGDSRRQAASRARSTWMCTWGGRSRRAVASCCTAPTTSLPTSTLPIDDGVSLTATVDILKAIAGGKGPDRAILALGYAGWRPGQLESEIQANGWLHCPPDLDLLFDRDLDQKYESRHVQDRHRSLASGQRSRARLTSGRYCPSPRRVCRAVQGAGEPLLPQSHLPVEPDLL